MTQEEINERMFNKAQAKIIQRKRDIEEYSKKTPDLSCSQEDLDAVREWHEKELELWQDVAKRYYTNSKTSSIWDSLNNS